MKTILFSLIVCLAAGTMAKAQKATLYGYVQKVVPGNIATRDLNEDGTTTKIGGASGSDYFLYLAGPAAGRLYVLEGWLKGERVGLTAKQIASPVQLPASTAAGETTELVPEHQGIVRQLTVVSASMAKATPRGRTLAASNDLVVAYKLNGNVVYATLKKLTELPPSYRQ